MLRTDLTSLTIGPLDNAAIRVIRALLEGLLARPGTLLTLDLTAIGDERQLTLHDLTLWVLVSQAAWKAHGASSALLVLNPPRRFAVLLRASPVPVVYRPPAAPGPDVPLLGLLPHRGDPDQAAP